MIDVKVRAKSIHDCYMSDPQSLTPGTHCRHLYEESGEAAPSKPAVHLDSEEGTSCAPEDYKLSTAPESSSRTAQQRAYEVELMSGPLASSPMAANGGVGSYSSRSRRSSQAAADGAAVEPVRHVQISVAGASDDDQVHLLQQAPSVKVRRTGLLVQVLLFDHLCSQL